VPDLVQTVRARATEFELRTQGDKLSVVMRVGRIDLSVALPAAAAMALIGAPAAAVR
jgi:hypothetical protein